MTDCHPREELQAENGVGAPARTSTGAHKLGPKANLGAINAGLRALDRSGKPCRKWDRKGFQVKSFTGVTWDVSSWGASKGTSEASDIKENGIKTESDSKANQSSSALDSEKSNNGDTANGSTSINGLASSPAPVAAGA